MTIARTTGFVALAIAASLAAGCLANQGPEAVDAGRYRLAADTLVDPACQMFTSQRGLLYGGLDTVTCLAGLAGQPPRPVGTEYPSAPPPTATLRRGSAVRVVRVFSINAVDAASTNAELLVTEPGAGEGRRVYSQRWPADRERYLVRDAAP